MLSNIADTVNKHTMAMAGLYEVWEMYGDPKVFNLSIFTGKCQSAKKKFDKNYIYFLHVKQ